MKLYYSPGASSLAAHIALHESGLPFEAIAAPLKTHKLPDGRDLQSINPLGYVPVLELDDGRRLREGAVILQYIADQVPERALAPAPGGWERYQLQEWLSFLATELHKGFSPLFNASMPAEAKTLHRDALARRFKWVNAQLADRPHLLGEHYTVADAYLFTLGLWFKPSGLQLTGLSHLDAHHARVGERAAARQALKAEGLSR